MTTANPTTTFTFADDVGGKYVAKYERDARGLHVWTVVHEDGEGFGLTDFANRERDLSAEEIERRAKGTAACLAYDLGLFRPDGGTDDRGFPTGKVYLNRTA